MKEIDFLPKWYKKARRRRIGYRLQYAVVLGVFAAMVGWSFFTARSISNAQAVIKQQEFSPAQKQAIEECTRVKMDLSELEKQAAMLKKLDSKVAIADVLAELSFLIDSRILLTQLDIKAEGFDDAGQAGGANILRVAKSGSASHSVGDIRFKLVLQGIACEAGDVARLICNLEKSSYFCRIIPDYSRTSRVKERQVSEFGISCYIANYREAKQ